MNAIGFIEPVEGELFQEQLHKNPFWMLVACSLVNLTSWKQAKPIFNDFINRSGGDFHWFARVDPEFLEERLEPLGLHRRRARTLAELPGRFVEVDPETRADVLDLPGCGQYAADSWAIFVEKDHTVNPTDKDLRAYLERMKMQVDNVETV